MRILYLHQYYKTPSMGGGIRSWHIAHHWADQGHEVRVITTWNGPVKKVERIGNLSIAFLPIHYDNGLGKWARIRAFRQFVLDAYREAKASGKADLVFATSTPLTIGLVALGLKAKAGIPYIFEIRDLWPEAPIQLGYVRQSLYIRALRLLESRIYAGAQRLVVLSPPAKAYLQSHPTATKKTCHIIPNIADHRYYHGMPDTRPTDRVEIVYAGTLGYANHVSRLLEVAKEAQDKHPGRYHFTISGQGGLLEVLKKQATEMGLQNISWVGHQSRAGVARLLAQAHFAWCGFRPEDILQTNSPNKFFEALAAGVPILLDMRGWLHELVIMHHCGLVYQADAAGLIDQICHAIESNEWAQMSRNCKELGIQYSLEITLEKMDGILAG